MPLCWRSLGVDSEHGHEDGDPSPCPEDEEFFVRPDAGAMDKAIGKFLDGLDCQELALECSGIQVHTSIYLYILVYIMTYM